MLCAVLSLLSFDIFQHCDMHYVHLWRFSGKELIDKRVTALGDGSLAGEKGEGVDPMKGLYLTHLLPGHSKNLTMEQIYSNVTDILLAGSDTVGISRLLDSSI